MDNTRYSLDGTNVIDQEGLHVCHCDESCGPIHERKAHAAFIVRACNCHDALLAACKRMLAGPAGSQLNEAYESMNAEERAIIDQARAAIAASERK
jgi:hypothetical protein